MYDAHMEGSCECCLTEEISKFRVEMHDLRASLIRWMFLFSIGQIGVLTGILFAFFRK